jgi:hypothetical protein
VNPFLEADVTHRADVLEFHGYGWEKSKLPYLAFMKEISVMSGKANISDDDLSSILPFIEKQPAKIRIGLNSLAVTKGSYTSLRTLFRDTTSLSTSYDKFLLPGLCAELGKSVIWTREHWNKEHPQFSKSKNL